MNDDQLRIGDAEREQAAAALGEHFVQGRLATEEHAERLDQVWAARTRSDLAPVFRDLPGHSPAVAPDRRQESGRRGFPTPLLPILAVLLAITVLTHVPVFLIGILLVVLVVSRRRRRAAWGRF